VNGAKLPDSYVFTSPTLGTLTPSETNYTTAPFTAKFTNIPAGTKTPIGITTRNNVWQAASVTTAPTLQTTAPANITGNTVSSLVLTGPSTTAAVQATGISFSGASTGTNTFSLIGVPTTVNQSIITCKGVFKFNGTDIQYGTYVSNVLTPQGFARGASTNRILAGGTGGTTTISASATNTTTMANI
jgi:hypothetical protein